MTNELSNEEAVAIIDKMLADDEMVLDILTEIEAKALRRGAEALRATDAGLARLQSIKSSLMHQRRFGTESLSNWRRAATSAEGDIEEIIAALAATQPQGESNG